MPPIEERLDEEGAHAVSLLSPEERAAMGVSIEDDPNDRVITVPGADADAAKGKTQADDSDDEPPAKKPDATDEDDDEAEDDEDDGVDAAAEAAAAKAAAEAAEAQATPQAEADAIAAIGEPNLTPAVEQYERRLEELDAAKAAKFSELMEGVITAEDYAQFESKYFRDRDAARDTREDFAGWLKDVHAFKVQALTQDGINYQADPEKAEAWDRWVRMLGQDPKHANKPGTWFLDEAHKMVKLQFSVAGKTTSPAAAAKKVAQSKGRAPNLSNIPPTLAGIPAAAESDAGDDGEFSHLDKLSGMDFERAIARLTPDQKERYERA